MKMNKIPPDAHNGNDQNAFDGNINSCLRDAVHQLRSRRQLIAIGHPRDFLHNGCHPVTLSLFCALLIAFNLMINIA